MRETRGPFDATRCAFPRRWLGKWWLPDRDARVDRPLNDRQLRISDDRGKFMRDDDSCAGHG
jgi:hypothetical protein